MPLEYLKRIYEYITRKWNLAGLEKYILNVALERNKSHRFVKSRVSQLRGTRLGEDKDNSGIYLDSEDFKDLLYVFLQPWRWRKQLEWNKWLAVREKFKYRNEIKCAVTHK